MKLLEKIRRSHDPLAPDRILAVGTEGIGKSTFASDAPKPIFLAAEDGLQHLDVDMYRPATYEDSLSFCDQLISEEHEFKTLVVDTLDWFESIVWEHTCRTNGWKSINRNWAEGYIEAVNPWKRFLVKLDQVRGRGMTIILLAHAQVKSFNDPNQEESYDRYEAKLEKRAYGIIKEWVDTHLFMHWMAWKDKKSKKITTDGSRVIHTQWCPAWDAKTRWPLPATMPLSWEDFEAHRKSCTPEDPSALKSEIEKLYNELEPEEALGKKIRAAIVKAGDNYAGLSKCRDRLNTLIQEKFPAEQEVTS